MNGAGFVDSRYLENGLGVNTLTYALAKAITMTTKIKGGNMGHELSNDDLKERVLDIEKTFYSALDKETARIFVRSKLSDIYYEGVQNGISKLGERLSAK